MTQPVRPDADYRVSGAPEIEEAVASLRSGWIGTDLKVARFEKDFRAYRSALHAMRIGRETVSLPLSAKRTDEDVDNVIAEVRAVLGP